MSWEDELGPPPQAAPNQQESNSIDQDRAGNRLADFSFDTSSSRRRDTVSAVAVRIDITLS